MNLTSRILGRSKSKNISFFFLFRSSMGFVEPRRVHVYPLRWHPPQPGSAHLQGQICQPGPVDTWADPGIHTESGPKRTPSTQSNSHQHDRKKKISAFFNLNWFLHTGWASGVCHADFTQILTACLGKLQSSIVPFRSAIRCCHCGDCRHLALMSEIGTVDKLCRTNNLGSKKRVRVRERMKELSFGSCESLVCISHWQWVGGVHAHSTTHWNTFWRSVITLCMGVFSG